MNHDIQWPCLMHNLLYFSKYKKINDNITHSNFHFKNQMFPKIEWKKYKIQIFGFNRFL